MSNLIKSECCLNEIAYWIHLIVLYWLYYYENDDVDF